MSDEDRARDIVSWHHDSAPLLVKDLVAAFATVRAEEREACEAIARAEEVANPSINGTIAAQRIKSAIRARP